MNNDLEQFSEERLKEIIDFAMAGAIEVVELARIALSVKQVKPVAWTSQSNLDAVALEIPNTLEFMSGDKGVYKKPVPLYTSPHPANTEQRPYIYGFDPALAGSEATVITNYFTPDGWKMVPEEATIAMLTLLGMTGSFEFMQQKYKSMLAAAPKPESE